MTKKKLLFLAHRLPYPPNKGDKIASFNLLRFLARRYKVFLGTFIDDPVDRQHRDKVRRYCQDLCAPEINPTIARIASLRGLLSGEALSLPYLRNRELYAWTTQVLREPSSDQSVEGILNRLLRDVLGGGGNGSTAQTPNAGDR